MERARILLVDDDEDVREMAAEILRSADFEVQTASGGPQAAAILRSGIRFDAVVTDQTMPGLDGIGVLEIAAQLQPRLPGLLMTGHADVEADVKILRKPFRAAALVAAVRALL